MSLIDKSKQEILEVLRLEQLQNGLLRQRLAAAEADTKRLDWIEAWIQHDSFESAFELHGQDKHDLREALDTAMEDGKR